MQKSYVKHMSLYVMVLLYVAAGVNHFLHPQPYIDIMPAWLCCHSLLVLASGICEILFGLLLLPKQTRRFAAWCIITLLAAVLPANIQMMLNYYDGHLPGFWLTVLRLPIQLVLIWWAFSFARSSSA